MDGWMDGWMDRQIDGQMDRQIGITPQVQWSKNTDGKRRNLWKSHAGSMV